MTNVIRITDLIELRIVNDTHVVLSEIVDTDQRDEVWIPKRQLWHVGAAICAAAVRLNNEGVG